jgi:predicted enzyme related to lactoylglutathione lyase
MKRVTGIGGVFFKAKDAGALRAWYQEHLGIDVQPWGGTAFSWADDAQRAEGCQVLEKTDDSEYGKFGWVMDPEGNKVELWQPPPGS